MEQKHRLYMLQLLRYFLNEKGYLRVNLVNKLDAEASKYDMWLINISGKYDVIHITFESDVTRKGFYPVIYSTFEKIHHFVGDEQPGNYLDISVNSQASDFEGDKIKYWSIYPGKATNQTLFGYENIEKQVYDVENPTNEIMKLEKEIALQGLSRNRSKISFENLKEKMCFSFLLPAVICFVVWLAIMITTKVTGLYENSVAIFFGAYYKAFIVILSQWWRLLTAGFVHISPLHLLCNLLALMNIAYLVEINYGKLKTMIILVCGITIGSLMEFIGADNQIVVGLSSGIYALFGTLTIFYWRNGYFKKPLFKKNYINCLTMNILISFLPNVSFAGHLGGFAVGLLAGLIADKKLDKSLHTSILICSIVIGLSFGFFAYQNQGFTKFYDGNDKQVAQLAQKLHWNNYADKILEKTTKYYSERN